jgi:hypothetical protein
VIEGLPSLSKLVRASVLIVVVLFGLAFLWSYLSASTDGPSYPYSEMLADAAAGRLEAIAQDGTELTVTIRGAAAPRTVQVVSESINVFAEVCAATGNEPGPSCPIEYEVIVGSSTDQVLGYLITTLLPVILIGAFFFYMMRAARQKRE